MSKPTLKVTSFTEKFNKIVERFKNDAVLVGIPVDTTTREDDKDAKEINNATILAINNFGSEENNIKPWPVMAIGIRNARDAISKEFANAAKNAFKNGISALATYYGRAGSIASQSVKKTINDQIELPSGRPAASTLAARKSAGFSGTKALIVTGQTRNAITYVIKGS